MEHRTFISHSPAFNQTQFLYAKINMFIFIILHTRALHIGDIPFRSPPSRTSFIKRNRQQTTTGQSFFFSFLHIDVIITTIFKKKRKTPSLALVKRREICINRKLWSKNVCSIWESFFFLKGKGRYFWLWIRDLCRQ